MSGLLAGATLLAGVLGGLEGVLRVQAQAHQVALAVGRQRGGGSDCAQWLCAAPWGNAAGGVGWNMAVISRIHPTIVALLQRHLRMDPGVPTAEPWQ